MNKVKLAVGVAAGVGLLSLPLAAHAVTGTTTVNATVSSSITLATSPTVALGVTPTAAGAMSSASGTATVNTNDATGYNLTLASSAATNTLVGVEGGTVPGGAGTASVPVPLAVNTWGYHINNATFGTGAVAETNVASSTTKFAAVPVSTTPDTLVTTNAVANDDVTTVFYGLNADTSVASDVYSREVTYTAVVNP